MASTKAIKSKIKSVNNIGKITKAMELVSASKMNKAVEAALATREYARRSLEILTHLSEEETLRHEYMVPGDERRNLLVPISSNKGLCGSYNINVEKAGRHFRDRVLAKREADFDFVTVGKYSESMARKMGGDIKASFVDIPEVISFDDIRSIAHVLTEEFLTGKYYNVVLIYTNYESALSQTPIARQLLPIREDILRNMLKELDDTAHNGGNGREDMALYLLEPDEEAILKEVLPRLTEVALYQALLEARASEHSARMVAMKNATENAEEMVDELTLSYNRARQAAITREISEIAAGADALSG